MNDKGPFLYYSAKIFRPCFNMMSSMLCLYKEICYKDVTDGQHHSVRNTTY
jgi:hypothetical protein